MPPRRPPRRPPDIACQAGAFTTAQAAADGLSPDALRHMVSTGRIDRLWKGVFATPVDESDAAGRDRRRTQLAVAAALTNTGVLVSHLGAAATLTVPAWAREPRPCATHDGSLGLTRLDRVHVHRAALAPLDRWRNETFAVTSPARTTLDITREFGLESGLCTADGAARQGLLGRADLDRALRQARDWPGALRGTDLLALVDPRAESVLETRSRWAMRLAGLPRPLTQVVLLDARGRHVARVDFFWPEYGVVGEADGRLKYDRHGAGFEEKVREDAVRRLDLGFVRWGWADLTPFDPTVHRLWEAFADAPLRSRGGRRWSMQQQPLPPMWVSAGSNSA